MLTSKSFAPIIPFLTPKQSFKSLPKPNFNFSSKTHSRFKLLAQNNNQEKEVKKSSSEEEEEKKKKNGGLESLFNVKWSALLLDPDPDNLLAVGLTGLLTWASVQVLWQLLFISLAILLAALKYSFIAALLVFILITLL